MAFTVTTFLSVSNVDASKSSLSKQAILEAIGHVNTPFLFYLARMQLS